MTITAGPAAPPLQSDDPAYAALRARRRGRVFDAMTAAGLDALILGRPAEVTYATGLRQLWLAGSRPFGPAAILIAATGRVHLLGTSEDGMPDELGAGDLFAMSWNPTHVRDAVAGLPGLAAAKRIGTTSLTPGFDRFLASVAPGAEIVDGARTLDAVRRVKDPDEIACIDAATRIAADALGAMTHAARTSISERELLAVYLGRLGELGAPTPPTEGVVCATGPGHGLRRLATDRRIAAGDRVVFDVAANVGGYEGGLGTTVVTDIDETEPTRATDPLAVRAGATLDAIVAACRPGVTGPAVRAAATSAGEALGVEPVVTGIGMGVEPPVVTATLGDDVVLEASMVLAVQAWVAEPGTGGWYERRLVVVDEPARVIAPRPARDDPGGSR